VRSEQSRAAILAATAALITRNGYDHVSIEGIAHEAGVGKQTIYRWWASKSAIVAECLLEGMLIPGAFVPPETDSLQADLATWVEGIFAFLAVPDNASLVRSIVAASVENPEVGAQLNERLGASANALAGRLRRAHESGQVRADISVELINDTLLGAAIARVLSRASFEPGDAHALTRLVLDGVLADPD
jgi:AcrR family transcriptional regulator